MADNPSIVAELTFLASEQGGRKTLPREPWGQYAYMPHAVVDGTDMYLGVRFTEGPQAEFEVPGTYRLELMYYPRVDYSQLTTGTPFTLREGGKVVASGRVVRGCDAAWTIETRAEIIIDGREFSTLEEFYGVIGRAIVGPDQTDSGNLDWLNDILWWPYGDEQTPYTLVWRNSEESRRRLGHAETVRQLEQRNVKRFPYGDSKVVSDLDAARRGEGPTVFDWLIETIEENAEYVELRLE